ncbi:MobP3 family relaxase [Chakrabartyella piscis]|uniref:MobP3 family relaxase n=1 Tax=Chakrabartyella piscis TaxID=2918914 RepID=UPI0029588B83|nr:MobP3 family relaxase [Chakrabartyella piscis]
MAKLILKFPYLKGGATHKKNTVEYMATRDGVVKNLVADTFLHDKKENYVSYISKRKGVEKVAEHGLFTSGNAEISLRKVAEEVANHEGNVWTPIISLKREDAEQTGFNHLEKWKNTLEQYAPKLAENMKIPIEDFCWYAAYHNHEQHPHVHLICYSQNPKKGYVTKQGIANCKSDLSKLIFKDHLQDVYFAKTERRKELKEECKKVFAEMGKQPMQNQEIQKLVLELRGQLNQTKGKKVYGYLPKDTKKLVDAIVDELEKEPSVQEAYLLWQEMQNQVYELYSDKEYIYPKLSEQKEFQSIKNNIIQQVLSLNHAEIQTQQMENISVNLVKHLSKIFRKSIVNKQDTGKLKVESKLFQKMIEKKRDQGLKL